VRVSAACAHARSRAWARAAPQPCQGRSVQIGQQPPRGRIRRDQAEKVRLVTQHREVSDRFPAVGEHHCQVHRDPAWIMTGLPDPQPGQRVTERTGQPGGIGKVSQQPSAGMPDDTPPISRGNDLGRDPVTCIWKVPPVAGWIRP
jgi:hypothetical protein